MRAMAKRLLQESRSGCVDADDADRQAPSSTAPVAHRPRWRKLGDIVMALRIEREFSRSELLLKYVNMPYFGRGQYGIEAASRAYFGKPAKDLALHQVAFIVSSHQQAGAS